MPARTSDGKPDRQRRSIRLKGYNYSGEGAYFVTICTHHRRCMFGEVVDGGMQLSATGRIVEACWQKVPDHFPDTSVRTFQIMPNHVHGIIQIRKPTVPADRDQFRRGVQLNAPTRTHFSRMSPRKGSLGVIVRTFKGAVTMQLRKNRQSLNRSIWQRNFYDHIIRDDISHFFVEQYIELNPILWDLDIDNPTVQIPSADSLQEMLVKRYGLKDRALQHVMELELDYRNWSTRQSESLLA